MQHHDFRVVSPMEQFEKLPGFYLRMLSLWPKRNICPAKATQELEWIYNILSFCEGNKLTEHSFLFLYLFFFLWEMYASEIILNTNIASWIIALGCISGIWNMSTTVHSEISLAYCIHMRVVQCYWMQLMHPKKNLESYLAGTHHVFFLPSLNMIY